MGRNFLESEKVKKRFSKMVISTFVSVTALCGCRFVSHATLPVLDPDKACEVTRDTSEHIIAHDDTDEGSSETSYKIRVKEVLDSICEGELKEKLKAINESSTSLDLRYIRLTSDDLKNLSCYLSVNTSLESINMDYCRLGDFGAKCLSETLMSSDTIKNISLRFNEIGNEGVKALTAVLEKKSNLISLDLSSNCIQTEGAKAIASAMRKSSQPIFINTTENPIGYDGASAILSAMKLNPGYTKLDLRYSLNVEHTSGQLQKRFTMTFNPAMPFYLNLKNCCIQELLLDLNMLSEDEVCLLAGALECETLRLKSISLSKTGLRVVDDESDKEAISELMVALRKNTSLERVNLADNDFGNVGAKLIADMLRGNTSITSVNLGRTHIGDAGMVDLIDAVHLNGKLRDCILVSNQITSKTVESMLKLSGRACKIHFDLSGNPLDRDCLGGLESDSVNLTVTFVCEKVVPPLVRQPSRNRGLFKK